MNRALLPHLYEAVAQGAMFGIVVFNKANGECLFINEMAKDMLGTESPSIADMAPPADRPPFKSFAQDILANDGLYHDILISSAMGTNFVGNLGVRALEVDGQTAHLLMMQDVTLQKKLQRDILAKQAEIKATYEELLKQNRQLRDLDLAKDRFIALTTHELRTPLAAMVSSAEILKMGLYDSPEQMQEFIEMIYDQGLHLQELVNDILDFAKIQAGKMDFYIEQQNPVKLVQTILNNFTGMAESNKVEVKFETPTEELLCYYDELRLKQIVANIINNAIKYNRTGGHVRVHFTSEADHIRILVEDTGKGIAEDQFSKVFNEFETVGRMADHHKGTGLGMPISRKLAEGMGGKLLLKSEVGVGSTFWIELPKEKVLDPFFYRPRIDSYGGDLAAS
jgi:signal transduction histidine kinase